MEEIAGIYPEARVIHIIRDGGDAAVSAAHHSWNFGKARKKNYETSAKRESTRRDPRELKEAGESIFAGRPAQEDRRGVGRQGGQGRGGRAGSARRTLP